MTKHTKGPWEPEFDETYCVRAPHGGRVATLNWLRGAHGRNGRLRNPEVTANANVIAAAPEMYEALEAAEQFITNGIQYGYIQMPEPDIPDAAHKTPGIVDKALAKARGGA